MQRQPNSFDMPPCSKTTGPLKNWTFAQVASLAHRIRSCTSKANPTTRSRRTEIACLNAKKVASKSNVSILD